MNNAVATVRDSKINATYMVFVDHVTHLVEGADNTRGGDKVVLIHLLGGQFVKASGTYSDVLKQLAAAKPLSSYGPISKAM